MKVTHSLGTLEPRPRAIAAGWFDGVHAGHRQLIDELRSTGLTVTVLTFRPHLRSMGRDGWEGLLVTVQRRLELLDEAGADDVVLVETATQLEEISTIETLAPALRAAGVELIAGAGRSGAPAYADLDTLEAAGIAVERMPEGVSSAEIRRLVRKGEVTKAAPLLGRPVELEGVVIEGKQRGRTVGYPTANIALAPGLVTPPGGIYAGAALGRRAGVSVGERRPGPGGEPRVETHLLGFDGDLYGQRLVIELWQRLRDERTYADESALIAQTRSDVARVEAALRPV